MDELVYINGTYKTPDSIGGFFKGKLPSIVFYSQFLEIVFRSSRRAKRLRYDTADWASSSLEVFRALESAGVKTEITGIDNFKNLEGPCVFVANHMSSFETFVLPAIIAQFRDATFVVKKSLVDYPVFKYIMRSRDPITVGRSNPRDDLKAVFEGGTERLNAGRSIVIFPQTTRTALFDPKDFNTIGIKLAKKAGVPVVPIALKTDAWGVGKYIKDFGKIDPSKKAHFAFGGPLLIKDRGTEEHNATIEFISGKLKEWER